MTRPAVPVQPKAREVIRKAPSQPWGGGRVGNTGGTKPAAPSSPESPTKTGGFKPTSPGSGNPSPTNTGGIRPSRGPAVVPTESWSNKPTAPTLNNITPGGKRIPGINSTTPSNPTQNPPVLRAPGFKPKTSEGSAFSKPLTPRIPVSATPAGLTPHHWGGYNPPPPPPPPPSRPSDNLRFSLNVGVGFGASFGFHRNWVNFSFGNACGYEPYAYPGYSWHRHRYYRSCGFDPYAHCNPWGGSYYVRSRHYYPFTYWYPGYTVSVQPCGSWYRVSYHRPASAWLENFNYASTPCETFSECALVTPIVVAPQPVFCWSPENTYRYSSVTTVFADAPTSPSTFVEESLPTPATPGELAHTTGRELGDTYMKLGDVGSAIRVYEAQVSRHPGDVMTLRSLGVALIERGEVERGTLSVERAYRIDPTLAQDPFDRELLRDPNNLGDVLDKATSLAGQIDGKPESAAAWLTVAVLMQADGRTGPARTALDKAKDAGLAPQVVEFMQPALPLENKP